MAVPDPAGLPKLTINLEYADTDDPYCTESVDFLYPIFTAHPQKNPPGYSRYGVGTSVIVLPDTYEEWWENVGYYTRRKVRRARKDGYTFDHIERDKYIDDIFEINTSMQERQGREMDQPYRERPKSWGSLPTYTCPRHKQGTYGVLKDGKLVAYTWTYQTGEMMLFSTLLGHGDHLKSGVMFLLIAGVLEDLIATSHTRYAVYERHWSGTEGLRFFKEELGFKPYLVQWIKRVEPPPTLAQRFARQGRRIRKLAATPGKLGYIRRRLRARLGPLKRRMMKR